MRIRRLLIIASCLMIIFTATACKQAKIQVVETKEVAAIEVNLGQGTIVSQFSGTLQTENETVASFELPGRIKAIAVEEGSNVRAGDRLAELDSESYGLQANIAQSTLEKAMAAYEQVLVDYNRYEELYKSGAIPLNQLEAIKMQLTASEKDMQSAMSANSLASLSLSKCLLKSPISGTVISKQGSAGQITNAGVPVLTIGNIARLKVVLQVPDYEISRWKDGDRVPVSLYEKTKEGTVTKILPSVSHSTGTIGVEITVDNTKKDWYPGQVVTCILETAGGEAIFVPAEAVISDGTAQPYVFVVKDDAVKKTFITPGKIMNDQLEITSGLIPGEIVVIKGAERLFDKDKIRIIGR